MIINYAMRFDTLHHSRTLPTLRQISGLLDQSIKELPVISCCSNPVPSSTSMAICQSMN